MSLHDGGPGWDDEPAPELLTSAADRERVDERVDSEVRRGGRFALRHPWWLAGLVAVLAGSVALGIYVAQLPPPVNPVVDIDVQMLGGGSQYVAVLRTPGERVHVLGVVGPGLKDPTSTMGTVTSGGPGIGNLSATIDCAQDGWWDAVPEDYQARVERTDAYGRVTVSDVPLDQPFDFWGQRVHRECLGHEVLSLPAATAVVDQGSRSDVVDVLARVTNPGARDLRMLVWDSGSDDFVLPAQTAIELPAGGSADVMLPIRIHCHGELPRLPSFTSHSGGLTYTGPGIPVMIPDGPEAEGQFIPAVIPWDASAEAEINAAAAEVCS